MSLEVPGVRVVHHIMKDGHFVRPDEMSEYSRCDKPWTIITDFDDNRGRNITIYALAGSLRVWAGDPLASLGVNTLGSSGDSQELAQLPPGKSWELPTESLDGAEQGLLRVTHLDRLAITQRRQDNQNCERRRRLQPPRYTQEA